MNTETLNSPASAGVARLWSRGLSALVGVAAAVAIAISSSSGRFDSTPTFHESPIASLAPVAAEPIQGASLESTATPGTPERIVVRGVRHRVAPAYDDVARAELQADVRTAMRSSRDQLGFEISNLIP